MPTSFRAIATPPFKRDIRRKLDRKPEILSLYKEMLAALQTDPYNTTGTHDIKKLKGKKPGQGLWRIRKGSYRLRYDIFGTDVVLYSFDDRKEAY
jgi:mRNA-degrading endonuclease RelE of RelBE toxin-antitoxin system